MFLRLALVVAVSLLCAAETSAAPLVLDIDECTGVDAAVVQRVVTMELGESPADAEGAAGLTRARAECRDELILVSIEDPVTGKRSARSLDLREKDRKIRSRLLGLAVSEAVLSSWIELALAPSPVVPSTEATASPRARQQIEHITSKRLQALPAAQPPLSAWQLDVGPEFSWFGSGVFLSGIDLQATRWWRRHPYLGMSVDLDGHAGSHTVSALGTVRALGASLTPRLVTRMAMGRLTVVAGVGWRTGIVRLSGSPVDSLVVGQSRMGLWAGPLFGLVLSLSLSQRIHVQAALDSGAALVPARGIIADQPVLALDGRWLQSVILVGVNL